MGEIYEQLEYTPYGELWVEHLETTIETTPFRFTGKERDSETGLYYFGARYLNPQTGMWLSADPAMGEYIPQAPINDEAKQHNKELPGLGGVFNYVNLHAYHYAGNNPVKLVDPNGRDLDIKDATDEIKMEVVKDVVYDLILRFSKLEERNQIIRIFSGNDIQKKFETAGAYARMYVDSRKEYFSMNRDSELADTSRDYQVYERAFYDMFDTMTTVYNIVGNAPLEYISVKDVLIEGITGLIPKLQEIYDIDNTTTYNFRQQIKLYLEGNW
jgi:RHS repeat-associated protein